MPCWAAFARSSARSRALVEEATAHPLLPGNHVPPLVDGDAAYPEMLRAIDGAQR